MNENKTVIFRIFNHGTHFNIVNRKYNRYNQINVSKDCLYTAMYQLSDVFFNVLGISISFEIAEV
jgi:hypothetical protein